MKTSFIINLLENFTPPKSLKWVVWKASMGLGMCGACRNLNGRIFDTKDIGSSVKWPQHLYCKCKLSPIESLPAGQATQDAKEGTDYYLVYKGKLPDRYLTKKEAEKLGWKRNRGNLAEITGGKLIGGNMYFNKEGILPQAKGRIWYEADINYTSGFRGSERIVYSNDGLVFVTYDHYHTFYEITGE